MSYRKSVSLGIAIQHGKSLSCFQFSEILPYFESLAPRQVFYESMKNAHQE